MDKNAIKKYAIWARRELIERVSQRAAMYGITEKDHGDPDADSVNGRLLSTVEKQQRKALIHKITEKGYQQVIEEVAYTWFNRFAALRFMEVNGYLPSHVRVFTNDAGEFKPQILTEAIHLDLEGLNKNKVYELENKNKTEELFKYLLIVQCNALNEILPGMFQKIDDYTELLLPDNLLRQGSVIEQMITMIPEEDWTDQVQIIGWLYQYYNTEPKDKVFADLKKNIKITKETIPAATQLFTPDWIVRYMVENSLGRLWLEGHPNKTLKSEWKYYLDEAEQEPDIQTQLDEIRKEYAALKPDEIRVIDPCMGSGHILCVLFDVLVQIYEDYGYSAREAAESIVENNLWGLDIDDRAAQLSYFAVMMKARQYDRRFFSRKIQPHVYAIEESNGISPEDIQSLNTNYPQDERGKVLKQLTRLLKEMHDAKEYGSIINVTPCDWDQLRRFVGKDGKSEYKQLDIYIKNNVYEKLLQLINIGKTLAQKYHVVSTNPPYMGSDGMDDKLASYIKSNYPICKSDLFAVFIIQCTKLLHSIGYQSMITQHNWMFLSSFEKLRQSIIKSMTINNMIHLGARAFEEISGEVVQTVAWVMGNKIINYVGTYSRLVEPMTQNEKESLFLSHNSIFYSKQELFEDVPNNPIAYWLSDNFRSLFTEGNRITNFISSRDGLTTGNNELFIKYFWEIKYNNISFGCNSAENFWSTGKKYAPLIKGGLYRKWYGNNWFVITFDKTGFEKLSKCGNKLPSREIYFSPYLTWNRISTKMAFRYCEAGYLFESASLIAIAQNQKNLMYALAFANSILARKEMQLINPTTNMLSGYVDSLYVPDLEYSDREQCVSLSEECVKITKQDWDSFETSWDFSEHPMVYYSKGVWDVTATMCTIHHFFGDNIIVNTPIEASWWLWKAECEERFQQLKSNEVELNHIFIDIYGLQDELTPEVADKDVTVRKADLGRDIRSFISYAVGCMFGRYSLDHEGLIFAGSDFNEMFSKRKEYLADGYYNPDEPPAKEYICLKTNDGRKTELSFSPDKDNILPICDDEYFADDIVGRFVKFVEVVYGKEKLEENLRFIADALGGKGAARDVIRNYFLNDFYADHLKVYQKRPIYWLFDSGKKNGFKCLIYMHRYQPDTIARIRTDYIHEQQSRYRTAIADLEQRINDASTSERVKLNKQLTKLQDQAAELKEYEEKIHHLADQMIKIDLDDGVKVNYAKFQDVLAKIK